jgi:cbb3-type cytochrome oxidase subunit 3
MAILFTLTVALAIIFYLYVLVQFRREEKRLRHRNPETSISVLPFTKAA